MVLNLIGGALDDRTPREAVREWVAGGLPERAAHDREVQAAVAGAPSVVELDPDELAALGKALDAVLPSVVIGGREAAEAGARKLLSRGILVDGWRGNVLAMPYLPTVGVALWADRSFTMIAADAEHPSDPAAANFLVVGTAGGRCAELRRIEDHWRVATTTLPTFADELGDAVGVGSEPARVANGISLACRWQAPDMTTPDLVLACAETILIWPEPPGVGWQVDGDPSATHLGVDEANAAIRTIVDRGIDADRSAAARLIAASKLAGRRWWNPVGGSTIGDAVVGAGLDWLWADPKAEARELAHLERRRRDLAASYWRPVASGEVTFIRGQG